MSRSADILDRQDGTFFSAVLSAPFILALVVIAFVLGIIALPFYLLVRYPGVFLFCLLIFLIASC